MRLLGHDVRRRDARQPLARRLGPLMVGLGVVHAVDVGANLGQFGLMLRREVGFTGRIDSYEPGREAFRALAAASADDESWHIHQAALSSEAGEAELHLHGDSSLNSLAETTGEGVALFRSWGSDERGREPVVVRRLADEPLPALGSTLLKLDTQGHDFEVIEGAGPALDRCALLLVELSFVPLYASSVPAHAALARLEQLGFGLVDLFPISRDADRETRLVEADGLFSRR